MNLINNLSMRGKLITLVAPALLVILFFAAESILLNYGELRDMRQLRAMVDLAKIGDPLTETLQKERGRSAVFLASNSGSDGARQAERDLREQRRQTDTRISDYRRGIEALLATAAFDREVETSLEAVQQGVGNLNALRRSIDDRSIAAGDSASRYTATIMAMIDRISLITRRSTDPELTRDVNAYYALAEVGERAGRERAVGFRDITDSASRSSLESHQLAHATSEQASELEQTFADILTDVNTISDMASQIATASEEQVAVTRELAGSMESVSEAAILTLTGSQEITQVTGEQARLAMVLQDLANEFKVPAYS